MHWNGVHENVGDAEDVLAELEHKVVVEEVEGYGGVNVVGGECTDHHYKFDNWLKTILSFTKN